MTEPATMEKKADMKKRGLGRGLNALFDDEESFTYADDSESAAGPHRLTLGLDQIEPGTYQPRRTFEKESLRELAESISAHGILQPIVVRPKGGETGRYEIVAGERRWRAAQIAQIHEVPVIVRDMDDRQALEIGLVENLQRQDLNPVEEALGYRRLMDEFGHTQEKAASVLGKSRSHVANTIRLLTLPPRVIDMLRDGRLSAGHARTLVAADNAEALAEQIVSQGLSVREAESLSAGNTRRTAGKTQGKTPKDVDTLALEQEMSNTIGMNVVIDVRKDSKGGRSGTVKIGFKNLDQLDELLQRLSQNSGR